jgi:7,8-dihydropterin-6-yl-methyl-4-(beta-D-ribofuranosyl)aminobenzene 5'-phosphate synthase
MLAEHTNSMANEIPDNESLQLTVVFNNVHYNIAELTSGWGFACVIEGRDNTILFDTGADGNTLLSNMNVLGLDPQQIDTVVLSHIHNDHTGGLIAFLNKNPGVTVYLPASFPASFQHQITQAGAHIETVHKTRHLVAKLHSSGEMGWSIKEQALIIDTSQGLILVIGCAHPNIVKVASVARDYLHKDIYLLMGGFHMLGMNDSEIAEIITKLKSLGVIKVAPSHCTGDKAIALFRKHWGKNFIEGGLGAVIQVRR